MQIYIILSIFNPLPSGNPQPSDYILVIGLFVAAMEFFLHPTKDKIPYVFILAVVYGAYALIINLIHYGYLPDRVFLFSSLYYIYNAAVFIFTASLVIRWPQHYKKAIFWALAISVVLEAFYMFGLGRYGLRAVGSFNNPNQFSYWTLLSLCVLCVLRYPQHLKTIDYSMILLVAYMIILGLSKSAFISFCFIMILIPFTRLINSKTRVSLLFVMSLVGIFSVFELAALQSHLTSIESFSNLEARISDIGQQNDDSLEARGYYRILRFPEYTLLGAGEGGYARFATPEFPLALEMHSGLGNVLFSYGILGFALFSSLMFLVFKQAPRLFLIFLSAIMLYGITHQNLRFSYVWVFFGLCYGISVNERREKEQSLYHHLPEEIHEPAQQPLPR